MQKIVLTFFLKSAIIWGKFQPKGILETIYLREKIWQRGNRCQFPSRKDYPQGGTCI